MRATHVPRIQNLGADLLSRGNPLYAEWTLHPVVVVHVLAARQWICSHRGGMHSAHYSSPCTTRANGCVRSRVAARPALRFSTSGLPPDCPSCYWGEARTGVLVLNYHI